MAPGQRSYTMRTKRKAIETAEVMGSRGAAELLKIPRRTLRDWIEAKASIEEFDGPQTSKTLKGQGAKSELPFAHELVTFMKDVRRVEEHLCTGLMIQYMKEHQRRWPKSYLAEKATPEKELNALMRLCQRFAARKV